MPIFEFFCPECKKKFQTLVGMTAEKDDTSCPTCGYAQCHRLMSRFARARSEDDRVDEIADSLEAMGEPDSPAAMREMMREMGKALDEDAADEMEEVFEADMESGPEDF